MKYFSKLTMLVLLLALTVPLSSVYAQTDSDGDGYNDDVDKCPNSVDLANRPVGPDGCHDADGDGLTGDDDLCPNSPLPSNALGCWDEDQDGFAYDPDYVNQISPRDNCPTEPGPINGCPDPNAPTSTPTNTPMPTSTTASTTDSTPAATVTSTTNNPPQVSPTSASVPPSAEACSNSNVLASRLEIDMPGTLVTDNNSIPVNFRSSSSTDSSVISVIREDEVFMVLDGPICTQSPNYYRWWNVYFEGRSGWIVESTSQDYLVRPLDLQDNAEVSLEELTEMTVPAGENSQALVVYVFLQDPPVALPPGTKVTAILSIPSTHTYTYIDIADGANNITILDSSTNDDDPENDIRLENFEITQNDTYTIYGESNIDGRLILIIERPLDLATNTDGGESTSSASPRGRGGEQPANTSSNGSGQTANPNSAAAAAAAARNNNATCNNVAVEVDIYPDSFFSPNGELLDGNASTGWTTQSLADAWFGVQLDDVYTITSIQLNGYSWTDNAANSVRDFRVTYYDGFDDTFETVFSGTADLEQGYVTYSFEPIAEQTLVIFIDSNYGGSAFEVTDVRICTS